MQRKQLFLLGTALALTCWGASLATAKDDQQGSQKGSASPDKTDVAKPAAPAGSQSINSTDKKPKDSSAEKQSANQNGSADELAIALTAEAFVNAYDKADAKAIAALFTKDAEYIDDQGEIVRGRDAIEEAFKESFAGNPGSKIQMEISSIRVVSPGVALEDGVTMVTRSKGDDQVFNRYSAVHVKSDGTWLVAGVRESTAKEWRQHRSRLQQLAWLNGEWVDEADDSVVIFKCSPVDSGSFLLRKFSIQVGGQAAMSGEQRIGWDPLAGKFRTWVFDSEGGFSEGFWYRDENHWELKTIGVTADGQTASSTTIYTLVNENTMTWQSVDHEIGGVQVPDSEPVTIVRRLPPPDSPDSAVTSKSE